MAPRRQTELRAPERLVAELAGRKAGAAAHAHLRELAPGVGDRLRRQLVVDELDHDRAILQDRVLRHHLALEREAQVVRDLQLEPRADVLSRRPRTGLDDREQRAAVLVLGDEVDLVWA